MVLAEEDCDDEFIVKRLKNGKLGRDEKSKILLGLSNSRGLLISKKMDGEYRLSTFRDLLSTGADPNWQAWETPHRGPFAYSRTPWKQHLFVSCSLLCSVPITPHAPSSTWHKWIQTKLAMMAGVIRIFIENGARLDDKIDMAMIWNGRYKTWGVREIFEIEGSQTQVFVSISAYSIVEILTATLRHSSRSNSFLDECVSSGLTRVDLDSSENCCVFGKLEDQSEESVLWETTHEMQTKLGVGLVHSLKRQLRLTMPDTEGDNQRQVRKSGMEETPHPILDDSSWIVKIRGKPAIFKWLEELELVKPVDKLPGISHWIKEYQQGHKSQQSGSTT